MAMGRAPHGVSCDVLFIFVAMARRVGVGHGADDFFFGFWSAQREY